MIVITVVLVILLVLILVMIVRWAQQSIRVLHGLLTGGWDRVSSSRGAPAFLPPPPLFCGRAGGVWRLSLYDCLLGAAEPQLRKRYTSSSITAGDSSISFLFLLLSSLDASSYSSVLPSGAVLCLAPVCLWVAYRFLPSYLLASDVPVSSLTPCASVVGSPALAFARSLFPCLSPFSHSATPCCVPLVVSYLFALASPFSTLYGT